MSTTAQPRSIDAQPSEDKLLTQLKTDNANLKELWDKCGLPVDFVFDPTPFSFIKHLENRVGSKNILAAHFRALFQDLTSYQPFNANLGKLAGLLGIDDARQQLVRECILDSWDSPRVLYDNLNLHLNHSQTRVVFSKLYGADLEASAKIAEPKSLQDYATNAIFTPATTPLSSPTETPEYVLTSVDPNLTSPVFVSLILHV